MSAPCKKVVRKHLRNRMEDLRDMWDEYTSGSVDSPRIYEYGLSFDYVSPNTFEGQLQAYFRYQLSWGGPSDEFRFFTNPDFSAHTIEYWYMDWGDGAKITLFGKYLEFMLELYSGMFSDSGSCEVLYTESKGD